MAFPEGSAWARPGFVLWHAALRWQREVGAALRDLDLTHVQFVLLAGTLWLERHGGPPSQRELAEHAGTDSMMASQVVRVLERRGLLERETDAGDRRVRRLRTTEEGGRVAREAIRRVERLDRRVMAGLDREATLDTLLHLADRTPEGRRRSG